MTCSGGPSAWKQTEELETFDTALTQMLRPKLADINEQAEFYALWQRLGKIDELQRKLHGAPPILAE
jgi:hypothetical protein